MGRPKKKVPTTDYHIQLEGQLLAAIYDRRDTRKQTTTQVINDLIRKGIAAEEGEATERNALPVLRSVLGEDQAAALEELRKAIHADMRADILDITGKQTDRLAALLVRAARSTSLAWRLIYRLIYHQYGAAIAQEWFEDERAKAGKAMASRTQTGKEIDQ